MSKLRCITFFISYPEFSGGAPRSMLHLAGLLRDGRKAMPTIATPALGRLHEETLNKGLQVINMDVPAILLTSRKDISGCVFYLKYVLCCLYFWIKQVVLISTGKLSFDKICFNDSRCFLFYLPIAVLNRKHLIYYVRINDRIRFISTISAILSSKIILISSSCINTFSKLEQNTFRNKISIVHTGFPSSESCKHESSEKISIGTVGVISERKNIELLIKSISLLDEMLKSKITVEIVGGVDGGSAECLFNLKSLVSNLNLNDVVRFTGHSDDISNVYRNLDILTLTSKAEGLPRVAIEALICGTYVISVPVDGVRDIIRSSGQGFIAEDYCEESFSKALKFSIENIKDISKKRDSRSVETLEVFSERNFVKNFIREANL